MQLGSQVIVAAQRDASNFELCFCRGIPCRKRDDDIAVVARRFGAILAQYRAEVAETVEDPEHPGDQRGVRRAIATTYLVERVFGGVRERGDARQRQKTRTALYCVNKAENRVELRAVGGVSLPRDNRPAGFGKDFRRFGQKVVQQIVHRRPGAPQKLRLHHGGEWLRETLLAAAENGSDKQ